jgi:hypothetical protein
MVACQASPRKKQNGGRKAESVKFVPQKTNGRGKTESVKAVLTENSTVDPEASRCYEKICWSR